MKKIPRKNLLVDTLHKGVVYSCIGITLYGSYLLGLRAYRYFTVLRPARQQVELQKIEDSAHNIDKAPILKT